MALPLTINVDLPSSAYAYAGPVTTEIGGATFGNDTIGTGNDTSSTSTILMYGAIALFIIYISKIL